MPWPKSQASAKVGSVERTPSAGFVVISKHPKWKPGLLPHYGKQKDTAIGYNPQKPGRPSHHPLACVIGGTRFCLRMEWRKGNTVSASAWMPKTSLTNSRPHGDFPDFVRKKRQ